MSDANGASDKQLRHFTKMDDMVRKGDAAKEYAASHDVSQKEAFDLLHNENLEHRETDPQTVREDIPREEWSKLTVADPTPCDHTNCKQGCTQCEYNVGLSSPVSCTHGNNTNFNCEYCVNTYEEPEFCPHGVQGVTNCEDCIKYLRDLLERSNSQ